MKLFADALAVHDDYSGVRDCLGKDINHFLVASVSRHTTYMFKNFITYRINRAWRILFPSFMIMTWFYILVSLLCLIKCIKIVLISRSRWPRGLRRRSAAAWLLRAQVRIPLRAWMFCLLCLYVVLSCVSRGLCNGLITRPEESYRVSNCVRLRNLKKRRPRTDLGCSAIGIVRIMMFCMLVPCSFVGR
jgi:hypothetical protein